MKVAKTKQKKRKNKAIGEIENAKNSVGIGTGILSFLFPFVGVIKAKNNIGKDNERAGQLLNIAIVGIVTNMVFNFGYNLANSTNNNQNTQRQ